VLAFGLERPKWESKINKSKAQNYRLFFDILANAAARQKSESHDLGVEKKTYFKFF
jgi:hypothetical protein